MGAIIMKPVIGIPRMGQDPFRKYMKSKYVQSLECSGAQVRWIKLEDPDRAVSEILECDGLLLPGGADVNPVLYGQEPSEKCGKPNTLRDTAEMKMLEAFLLTNKPVLCICRGVQLLNVFFGGTLHQDIKLTQAVRHSDFRSRNKGIHQVRLFSHTRLAHILNKDTVLVNSLHHQAVDRVGLGLTVSAVSGDGFIEALEIIHHPFCIGVQWHPEHMSKKSAVQQSLFDAFVNACGEKRR